jgi:hypothetical protein
MDRFTLTPDASDLLQPVLAGLRSAAARLPAGPSLRVAVGADDHGDVVLPAELLGPAPFVGADADGGIDRWRRAAAKVLEGLALAAVAERVGVPARPDDWRWLGVAIHLAARAWPELGVLPHDVATAVSTLDPGAHPRAGAAVAEIVSRTVGPDALITSFEPYLVADTGPDPDAWLALGRRLLDPVGVRALASGSSPPPPRDVPTTLTPWSWALIDVPAHPRGGRIVASGPGVIAPEWAVGGAALRGLAAAASDVVTLRPESGGPVGRWRLTSAHGFGQIMGARGIMFVFHPSGRFELVLADSFVGPLAAAAVAHEVGSSGLATGRWRVTGPHELRLDGLTAPAVTVHRRDGEKVVMPGDGTWIPALGAAPWAWTEAPDGLRLVGTVFGGPVDVRLREDVDTDS